MTTEATTVGAGPRSEAEKPVMVVALDESEHSYHALEWALQHFFADVEHCPPLFSLVLVHAKPSPIAVVGVASPGVAEVWPFVESNLREIAAGITSRAKNLLNSRSVKDAIVEVIEGDARVVILEAAERHRASVLVLGSHGYGAFKRAVLGSVSDYCVHNANCSVLVVKKPKESK